QTLPLRSGGALETRWDSRLSHPDSCPTDGVHLREIVPEIVVADRAIGDFVVAAASEWTSPNTEKEALEFRILVSEIDYRNYSVVVDRATGTQGFAFTYPQDVITAIKKFEQEKLRSRQALMFPQRCRNVLSQ